MKSLLVGQRIPLGVDPGFNFSPGSGTESLQKMLADKIDAMPDDLKGTARKIGFLMRNASITGAASLRPAP